LSAIEPSNEKPARTFAPLLVFSCIIGIGAATVAVVMLRHCQHEDRYDDPTPVREIAPGVLVPPETRPGSGVSR